MIFQDDLAPVLRPVPGPLPAAQALDLATAPGTPYAPCAEALLLISGDGSDGPAS